MGVEIPPLFITIRRLPMKLLFINLLGFGIVVGFYILIMLMYCSVGG